MDGVSQAQNVALVISKALDYENAKDLFCEDEADLGVARRSLHLLELLFLVFENWSQLFLAGKNDPSRN